MPTFTWFNEAARLQAIADAKTNELKRLDDQLKSGIWKIRGGQELHLTKNQIVIRQTEKERLGAKLKK